MDGGQLLPIKVVFPSAGDYRPPPSPKGNVKIFGAVTEGVRAQIAEQLESVAEFFEKSFREQPGIPAVAKVKLKPQAVAKTHRPYDLFDNENCPIIGGGGLGELFVSVRQDGLAKLAQKVRTGQSQVTQANISVIADIRPYTADDALHLEDLAEANAISSDRRVPRMRFRMFRHPSQPINAAIDAAFFKMIRPYDLGDIEAMDYAEGMSVYCLHDLPARAIRPLAAFVGTQSLSMFPQYQIVRTAARSLGNVTAVNFPAPEQGRDYGLVGVIDSGTDPNNPYLQAWVVDRFDFVPRELQNHDHGSFVAGLIAHGNLLNHGNPLFPVASSKVVDVAVFDRDGEISEYDLMTAIDEAIRRFPHVKIWNLSLGLVGDPCCDHEFSELGGALDERARRHGITFVVAAGNYEDSPFRAWPPQAGIGEEDRICPPADSIRSITVGATAHVHTHGSRVRQGEPAPFSRRGPGAAYLLKPELSAPGGNCDSSGQCVQTGVISIDGAGHIAENIGTSFATPLIASLAASVERELTTSGAAVTPAQIKALLLHAAFMRNFPFDSETINYFGLGCPPDVSTIVNCRQSAATIILDVPVRSAPEFAKRPFPMPQCLVDPEAGLRGEVFMTLLYDPPLDRNFGVEYCRVNINASLGVIGADPATGKEHYSREVHPVPKEQMDGYERDLVRHGLKWSPLKLYYRNFSRGPVGKEWRLSLDMLNRADFTSDEEQRALVIVTIRDPLGEAKVYDEVVRDMTRLGWITQDLQVRSRSRLRP